jgi:hypothetical protein
VKKEKSSSHIKPKRGAVAAKEARGTARPSVTQRPSEGSEPEFDRAPDPDPEDLRPERERELLRLAAIWSRDVGQATEDLPIVADVALMLQAAVAIVLSGGESRKTVANESRKRVQREMPAKWTMTPSEKAEELLRQMEGARGRSTEDMARILVALADGLGLTLPRKRGFPRIAPYDPKYRNVISEVTDAISQKLRPNQREAAAASTVELIEAGLGAYGYRTRGMYAYLRMAENRKET